ncbi:hypothetical protein PR048_000480 [Dryococelus australis]|uniref:Uncharacterized protein n=1 Tax=Dryococelus australis TaxID=614101 RepID=A0ABQ9IEQ5_9NEOP|nr:hypothetical protein PR048_000480 [Dryococelus australis]
MYYNKTSSPILEPETFKSGEALFVFDVSKQDNRITNSVIDSQIEIIANTQILWIYSTTTALAITFNAKDSYSDESNSDAFAIETNETDSHAFHDEVCSDTYGFEVYSDACDVEVCSDACSSVACNTVLQVYNSIESYSNAFRIEVYSNTCSIEVYSEACDVELDVFSRNNFDFNDFDIGTYRFIITSLRSWLKHHSRGEGPGLRGSARYPKNMSLECCKWTGHGLEVIEPSSQPKNHVLTLRRAGFAKRRIETDSSWVVCVERVLAAKHVLAVLNRCQGAWPRALVMTKTNSVLEGWEECSGFLTSGHIALVRCGRYGCMQASRSDTGELHQDTSFSQGAEVGSGGAERTGEMWPYLASRRHLVTLPKTLTIEGTGMSNLKDRVACSGKKQGWSGAICTPPHGALGKEIVSDWLLHAEEGSYWLASDGAGERRYDIPWDIRILRNYYCTCQISIPYRRTSSIHLPFPTIPYRWDYFLSFTIFTGRYTITAALTHQWQHLVLVSTVTRGHAGTQPDTLKPSLLKSCPNLSISTQPDRQHSKSKPTIHHATQSRKREKESRRSRLFIMQHSQEKERNSPDEADYSSCNTVKKKERKSPDEADYSSCKTVKKKERKSPDEADYSSYNTVKKRREIVQTKPTIHHATQSRKKRERVQTKPTIHHTTQSRKKREIVQTKPTIHHATQSRKKREIVQMKPTIHHATQRSRLFIMQHSQEKERKSPDEADYSSCKTVKKKERKSPDEADYSSCNTVKKKERKSPDEADYSSCKTVKKKERKSPDEADYSSCNTVKKKERKSPDEADYSSCKTVKKKERKSPDEADYSSYNTVKKKREIVQTKPTIHHAKQSRKSKTTTKENISWRTQLKPKENIKIAMSKTLSRESGAEIAVGHCWIKTLASQISYPSAIALVSAKRRSDR